ncbi:uncharacterized protein LOC116167025 [Photinus pyralis]|uniref:uncharacterized protein LOC116167025 n=1 Tax=Photinus pyralis TaxID=7054 RepID=UPI0012676F12|nr:uncharacterized protein LOC116167025 [Photinus pyralis]
MNRCSFISVVFCLLAFKITCSSPKSENSLLLRRKRYLVFPEGSSLSIAICLTAQTTLPEQIFTEAINWGIAYDLPNESSVLRQFLHPKHVMQRRNRRDLYRNMETIMDSMGFNGRSCILRALCETSRRFLSRQTGLVEELIRIAFRFPLQKIMNWEPEEHRLYHWAYRIGHEKENTDCADLFSECSFSLLDMALGEYADYSHGYT